MKTMSARLAAMAGVAAMALLSAAAGAQCLSAAGWKAQVKPAAWTAPGGAKLVRAAYPAGQDLSDLVAPIVGMWHVKLVASSAVNAPVPPGAEVDAGYQQWHNDGTEMLNSGRPAANTNFCMGVWEQTGARTFRLNHFAISYTQTNGETAPVNTRTGPTSIVEEVTVSPDGNSFSGTFTITDYAETDPAPGQPGKSTIAFLDSITGKVTGTRITVSTPVTPIF